MRASLSRFVAIFAIVALGVGFLSGLLASPVDMRLSADEYCREANLYDIKIQSTQGLTDEDLAAVRAVEGVSSVMPARDMDLVLTSESGESLTTRLQSIPEEDLPEADRLNQLTLAEGRMPSAPGEIAVGLTKDFSGTIPAIGDVLTVNQTENDESVTDALPQTFTVVGTVRSAAYFSVEAEYTNTGTGTIGLFAYAPESCFDMDYYTTFYLSVEGAKELNSFSAAYEDKVDGVMEGLEAIQDERVQARYEEIIDEAEAELDDAWAEYEENKAEAEQELADAAQELEDGWAELADAEQELADAKLEIDRGQAELDDGKDEFYRALPGYKQQIADGYSKLESSRAQLDSAQTQLDEGRAQLEQLKAGKDSFWAMVEANYGISIPPEQQTDEFTIQVITILEKLASGGSIPGFDLTEEQLALLKQMLPQLTQLKKSLEALDEQETTLDASLAALDEKQAEIDAGRRQIEDGLSELQAQERQLEKTKIDTENQFAVADEKLLDARQQYADGLAELEEGRQELIDGQKEYEDAKAEARSEEHTSELQSLI